MASRRKKRTQQADVDPLGGFSLEDLMGLDPITQPESKKPSLIGRLLSLPFRLAAWVIRLPFRILGLPVRIVRAILPSRNKDS